MENFWSDFRKNLRAGVRTVYKKAEELTRVGRLKLEIVAVKRDIEKAFIELGGRLYHQIDQERKYDTKDDPEVAALVTKIRNKEDRLEELEKNISDIQDITSTDNSAD